MGVNGEIWTGQGTATEHRIPSLCTLPRKHWPDENVLSISFRLRYGNFRFFNGGDQPGIRPNKPDWFDIETPVAKVVGPVDAATSWRRSPAPRPHAGIIQKRHLHDLGKLLFAFNMLWAYFDFSQLLIIWSGNQPEEITFYRTRLYGGWGVVAVIVLLFSFALPFLVLLSRDVKRSAGLISKVAIWMILMRLVDLYWMTRPEFSSSALPTWLDIVVPIALIGLWVGFFAFNLKQQPLLPLGDPKLAEAIAHHEH